MAGWFWPGTPCDVAARSWPAQASEGWQELEDIYLRRCAHMAVGGKP